MLILAEKTFVCFSLAFVCSVHFVKSFRVIGKRSALTLSIGLSLSRVKFLRLLSMFYKSILKTQILFLFPFKDLSFKKFVLSIVYSG